MPSSRRSSRPRDGTQVSYVSCIGRQVLYHLSHLGSPNFTSTWTFTSVNSVAQSFPTLCNPMYYSTPGLPVHCQLPEFTQTHVHWVGDAIQPSNPLSSPSTPTFNLSQDQSLFKRVSFSHQMAKYWSFSFSISPSNEYLGLISFRMDWLDLIAVQGTLKRLIQHHSSKASILQHSAFFIVQFSHPYMTTGKTIALTRQTFVSKVINILVKVKLLSLVRLFATPWTVAYQSPQSLEFSRQE